MRLDIMAAVVGVGAGAAITTLLAKQQVGSAATTTLAHLGLPPQLLGAVGADDPLAALKQLDPAGATQLETAWLVSVIGGAVAAVAAYVIVDGMMG